MYTKEKLIEILESEDAYNFKEWIEWCYYSDDCTILESLSLAVDAVSMKKDSIKSGKLMFIFENTYYSYPNLPFWAIEELVLLCNKQEFLKLMAILEKERVLKISIARERGEGLDSLEMLDIVARHRWDFLLDYLSENVQRLVPGYSSKIAYVLLRNNSMNSIIPLIIAHNINDVWAWLAEYPSYQEFVNRVVITNEDIVNALSDERESVRSGVLWGYCWNHSWNIQLDEESIVDLFNIIVEMFSTVDLPDDTNTLIQDHAKCGNFGQIVQLAVHYYRERGVDIRKDLIIEVQSENWARKAAALTILSYAHIQGQLLVNQEEATDDEWILPDTVSDLLFGGISYGDVTLYPLDIVDIWCDEDGIHPENEFIHRIQLFARDSNFQLSV